MKVYGLWYEHRYYRKRYRRALAADVVDGTTRGRGDFWPRTMPIYRVAHATLVRFLRMRDHKGIGLTVRDFRTLARYLGENMGNEATVKALLGRYEYTYVPDELLDQRVYIDDLGRFAHEGEQACRR